MALPYGLSNLLKLDPVQYSLKNNTASNTSFGLIAQDVEPVIPELVNCSDGFYGVDYISLVPVLINAVKEQQKQIQELREMINSLNQSR